MNVQIRKAKKEDIEEIWNIGNNVTEFKTADNVVWFWPENVLQRCIDKEDILFYVVEVDKAVVGFTIVNLNQSLGKAEIENIYVLPNYRQNGLGKRLLDAVIQELTLMKYNNVNCLADEAIKFYEHYGFTKGKDFAWMDIVISDDFKR